MYGTDDNPLRTAQGLKMSSSGSARKFLYKWLAGNYSLCGRKFQEYYVECQWRISVSIFDLPTKFPKLLNLLQFCCVEILIARPCSKFQISQIFDTKLFPCRNTVILLKLLKDAWKLLPAFVWEFILEEFRDARSSVLSH